MKCTKHIFLRWSLSGLLFTIAGIGTFSCNNVHTKEEVETAMKQYDHLILKLDADSIALLYTPDGDLGTMAHGRDSIRKFLSSFKNIRVLSQASITTLITMTGDSAIQKGTYRQTALIAEKDTIKVKGEYIANWLWIPSEGWHIKRMITKPAG
jgi:hypothetical protein